MGRDQSRSELNQSPPSEGVASAVVKTAQLFTCGAETAAGSGGRAGLREQQGRSGADAGKPMSVRARAIIGSSVDTAVVPDVTGVSRAMADLGASAPNAKQAITP
jgi:hypothetical protein